MSECPKKFYGNLHLFLSAFLVSLIAIICVFYYQSIPYLFKFEYVTFFTILLACSLPFLVLDPPIWYCIFMTTFSHMLFLKEFHTFSLITVAVMMVGLLIRRTDDSSEDDEKEILHPV